MADTQQGRRGTLSEPASDDTIDAAMASDDDSDTWEEPLDPIHLSEHVPFWWRPRRGRDDLWMEIMALRGTEVVKVR
jgi:hypothetical protein